MSNIKLVTIGAVFCAAPFLYSMHVSSDGDAMPPVKKKIIEMKNFAERPPQNSSTIQEDSDKAPEGQDAQVQVVHQCFGIINKSVLKAAPPHSYTLTSVDKSSQEKPT